VFLPYIDYCLYAIGLLGSPFASTKFGGICMRPNFHHPVTGVVSEKGNLDAIKWKLFNRVLNNKNLGILFAIDTLLVSISHRDLPHVSSRIRYLADPVDDVLDVNVQQVRAEFGATDNTKTILVYGALDERKGLILLLDALENERFSEDWHVWLIGRQSNNIREMLSGDRWAKLKQQQRVQVCDKFVTKEIEQKVLAACDVIWLAYRQHYGMSGVMVHAGRNKKATITCNVGLIGWYANKFKIGIPISPTCKSVIEALSTLSNPANRQAMASNGEECFKSNTWGNFAKILVSTN
jgi:glycosyltransferase involved in cell wall biosynthesis